MSFLPYARLLALSLAGIVAGAAPVRAQGPRVDDARVGVSVQTGSGLALSHEWRGNDADRSRHEMRGALIGSALGTIALGVVIASIAAHKSSSDGPPPIMGLLFLPVAGVSGALVGAVVGHMLPTSSTAQEDRRL